MITDPLGLERCAVCGNAFYYDKDKEASAIWQLSGHHGFVCHWCAEELTASDDSTTEAG